MAKKYESKKKKLAEKSGGKDGMFKTHHSTEYCRHCGKKIRTTSTSESSHREYDHEKHESPEIARG